VKAFKVGQSVRVMTFGRTDAIGKVKRIVHRGQQHNTYEVRLPNWQADGVHLDVFARADELQAGHGRAAVCRCVYCPGYRPINHSRKQKAS
jgi:hypothetical protein